ncbi:hypothetical protein HanXRQr2_Chr15g0674941 [Helianthus annuus]|uniref:Uncharacterized protein n=1 Tax=Helianthus annuus TaxID=4232 RepID=A0A9K3DWP4_HELAN|nr:hypothetical protein HanXRQr2_Chr15g0674941 [Helianthus annuus]KAJ0829785.1 hypothetical protein HanPSC8_Chr15g0647731 [Helianthus annuus]
MYTICFGIRSSFLQFYPLSRSLLHSQNKENESQYHSQKIRSIKKGVLEFGGFMWNLYSWVMEATDHGYEGVSFGKKLKDKQIEEWKGC